MEPRPVHTALKSASTVLLVLVAGILAWALWPQEFRFERTTPAGRERAVVYTRWGCVVKEVVLESDGGAPVRARTFPLGRVPLWRIGALPAEPGAWHATAEGPPP